MKLLPALSMALPMVAAGKVSYDGFEAFHIKSSDLDSVKSALANLNTVSLGCGSNHDGLDIAVAPDSLEAFKNLDLDVKLIHEDLGADLTKEGSFRPYKCTFLPAAPLTSSSCHADSRQLTYGYSYLQVVQSQGSVSPRSFLLRVIPRD